MVLLFVLVYAEVEMKIGALMSLLLEKLLQTPSTLHDQKRYIRSPHSPARAISYRLSAAPSRDVYLLLTR